MTQGNKNREVVLLCGSLRPQSANRLLLQWLAEQAPAHWRVTQDTLLGQLPLYNEALDPPAEVSPVGDPGALPDVVRQFRAQLARADGVIVACPEYNHDISGALKNALDWSSRPRNQAPLAGKCTLALVATSGAGFGFQGLAALQRILWDLNNFVLVNPRVVLQRASTKLQPGADGRLALQDPMAAALLRGLLLGLEEAMAGNAGQFALAGGRYFRPPT